MHAPETVERALELSAAGTSASAVAREVGVARATVRDWRSGKVPRATSECAEPWSEPGFAADEYCHLLGLYLGDGCISHAQRTTVLRISFDAAYPRLIAAQWRRWPDLFPQHGPGMKHTRRIELSPWQRALTIGHPEAFVRGLLHSDGCRYVNRVRVAGREYAYPSYGFTNVSEDIKTMLCDHLDLLDIAWRRANSRNIAITRRGAVARLDEFVGPKR